MAKLEFKLGLDDPAAAAKSLQSCPTLCNPIDGSPPGSPILRILQARTPEWVAMSFSNEPVLHISSQNIGVSASASVLPMNI